MSADSLYVVVDCHGAVVKFRLTDLGVVQVEQTGFLAALKGIPWAESQHGGAWFNLTDCWQEFTADGREETAEYVLREILVALRREKWVSVEEMASWMLAFMRRGVRGDHIRKTKEQQNRENKNLHALLLQERETVNRMRVQYHAARYFSSGQKLTLDEFVVGLQKLVDYVEEISGEYYNPVTREFALNALEKLGFLGHSRRKFFKYRIADPKALTPVGLISKDVAKQVHCNEFTINQDWAVLVAQEFLRIAKEELLDEGDDY